MTVPEIIGVLLHFTSVMLQVIDLLNKKRERSETTP